LELVVANLSRELAKRGYDVTVFATENSAIDGCKVVSLGKELGTTDVDWLQAERNAFDMYKKQLSGFDIVHGHTWYGFYLGQLGANPRFPVLHTHHGGLSWPPYRHTDYLKHLRNAKFNRIAKSKRMQKVHKEAIVELLDKSRMPLGIEWQVAYNGVDLDKYKFRGEKREMGSCF
jgi:hypothetical protein